MKKITSNFDQFIPKYLQRRVRHSVVYLILFFAFIAFSVGIYKGGVRLVELKGVEITLSELPYALFLSFLRMLVSYSASIFFAFGLGLLAARTLTGERIIIPLLDILQSVPVVGFFPAAITFFINLSHGHRMGIEMATIFLIFTSQAWNLAFAVYEATKTIPQDRLDAVASFGVRGSLRFWKLYAPACVPRFVYNSILSWSNGWYFLVACEIISVGPIQYHLPGIGSFLARAAEQDQIHLVFFGLLALTGFILFLDFFIWRPLEHLTDRFKQDYSNTESSQPSAHHLIPKLIPQFFLNSLSRELKPVRRDLIRMLRVFFAPFAWFIKEALLPVLWDLPAMLFVVCIKKMSYWFSNVSLNWFSAFLFWMVGLGLGMGAGTALFHWLQPPWPPLVKELPFALLASTARLILALLISLIWTLPIVLYSWNKPKLRQTLMTFAQIGASLPAIALFPLIILIFVRRFGGGMEFASILLLLTGMQWYVLFNGLGGVSLISNDLAEVSRSLGLSRLQTWKRLVLPAIHPALITGAITAWGGGWNALVVAEYVPYKDQVLSVQGIGSLLSRAVYQLGDSRAISFCIAAMVGWILIINLLVWRPLYQAASERYKFDV
jgi:NitT/TauT family transport system permease protein